MGEQLSPEEIDAQYAAAPEDLKSRMPLVDFTPVDPEEAITSLIAEREAEVQ